MINVLHANIVEAIIVKSKNIEPREFKISEGKIALQWLKNNFIEFDEDSVDLNESRYPFADYRVSIKNEKDKVKYDKFFADRTVELLLEHPWESFKFIFKKSIHITLLNPFHIYSDHNFLSGEIYYTSLTHDRLVPARIIYSLIIYSICAIGFYNLIRKKDYKLLLLIIISILYFYSLVSWHGNTRYFVPVMIYLSFFFGNAFEKISFFKFKKN